MYNVPFCTFWPYANFRHVQAEKFVVKSSTYPREETLTILLKSFLAPTSLPQILQQLLDLSLNLSFLGVTGTAYIFKLTVGNVTKKDDSKKPGSLLYILFTERGVIVIQCLIILSLAWPIQFTSPVSTGYILWMTIGLPPPSLVSNLLCYNNRCTNQCF